MVLATCTHILTFWDIDEERCRTCGQSLSYPPHPPTPEESSRRSSERRVDAKHKVAAPGPGLAPKPPMLKAQCTVCRAVAWDEPDEKGNSECENCGSIVAQSVGDGWTLPAVKPFPTFSCSCCKLKFPALTFAFNGKAKNRLFRDYTCRGCTAFRARVHREVNGESVRAAARVRAASVRERRAAGLLPPVLSTPESKESANAATRRAYARRAKGRNVPRQRQGRPVLHVKPVCRIRVNCPLAVYCVDKEPSDQPLKV